MLAGNCRIVHQPLFAVINLDSSFTSDCETIMRTLGQLHLRANPGSVELKTRVLLIIHCNPQGYQTVSAPPTVSDKRNKRQNEGTLIKIFCLARSDESPVSWAGPLPVDPIHRSYWSHLRPDSMESLAASSEIARPCRTQPGRSRKRPSFLVHNTCCDSFAVNRRLPRLSRTGQLAH